jgi:hypothetical protein
VVDTNINFEELNRAYHQRVPATHSSLSPAYLMIQILAARKSAY